MMVTLRAMRMGFVHPFESSAFYDSRRTFPWIDPLAVFAINKRGSLVKEYAQKPPDDPTRGFAYGAKKALAKELTVAAAADPGGLAWGFRDTGLGQVFPSTRDLLKTDWNDVMHSPELIDRSLLFERSLLKSSIH